jgi:hypothetical protein
MIFRSIALLIYGLALLETSLYPLSIDVSQALPSRNINTRKFTVRLWKNAILKRNINSRYFLPSVTAKTSELPTCQLGHECGEGEVTSPQVHCDGAWENCSVKHSPTSRIIIKKKVWIRIAAATCWKCTPEKQNMDLTVINLSKQHLSNLSFVQEDVLVNRGMDLFSSYFFKYSHHQKLNQTVYMLYIRMRCVFHAVCNFCSVLLEIF